MIMINKTRLSQLIEQFQNAKVLVIGDLMLDKFIWGEVTRISPEAPVPIVHVKNETFAPGGAANAAMNVASLGAQCHTIGLTGEDSARDILITLLRAKNINTDGILTSTKPTIQKIRIMGNNQHLVRFDYEEKNDNEKEKEMIEQIKKIADKIDIILVSDYAKGTITETMMSELKKTGKKIIVDPKSNKFHTYKGAYAIKPNQTEASEITGTKETTEQAINEMGKQLLERSNSNILLSRGKDGISVFELDGTISHLPSQTKDVCDVTGAGDTVVATLSVAIATGANLKEATTLANYAAGITVSKIGTVTVSKTELQNSITEKSGKLKTKQEITNIANELKQKNKKIVFTSGCFDILHIGHTRLLQHAKSLGDTLILALDTDTSVKELKGKDRPIISQSERAEILSALDCIDHIIFFDHNEIEQILTEIKPDVLVKGESDAPHLSEEKQIVEKYGGETIIIPLLDNSTSEHIIEKVKQLQ